MSGEEKQEAAPELSGFAAVARKPAKESPPSGLDEAKKKFEELLAEQAKSESEEKEVAEETPEKEPKKKASAPSETDKLREKLVLAGAPRKAIESLSDEDVREWWTRQESRERAQTEALIRASRAEKALEETTTKAEPAVPTAEVDLEEIAEELNEQFGESESGAILKALKKLVEPLQAEVSQTRAILVAAQKRGAEDIANQNRERLGKDYERLKEDEDAWSIVRDRVFSIFEKEPKRYASATAAFDDVARALYGEPDEKPREDAAEKTRVQKARISASSVTPPQGAKREKSVKPEDAHWATFKYLNQPGHAEDVDGASRAFRNIVT